MPVQERRLILLHGIQSASSIRAAKLTPPSIYLINYRSASTSIREPLAEGKHPTTGSARGKLFAGGGGVDAAASANASASRARLV
jgi:hypothetical protein